jgi:hypothetical protein
MSASAAVFALICAHPEALRSSVAQLPQHAMRPASTNTISKHVRKRGSLGSSCAAGAERTLYGLLTWPIGFMADSSSCRAVDWGG